MQRVAVSPSDIASVGYDATSQTLEIEFNSGGVYQYYEIPQVVHGELMAASSHGEYFHRNVREHYQYRKVR